MGAASHDGQDGEEGLLRVLGASSAEGLSIQISQYLYLYPNLYLNLYLYPNLHPNLYLYPNLSISCKL